MRTRINIKYPICFTRVCGRCIDNIRIARFLINKKILLKYIGKIDLFVENLIFELDSRFNLVVADALSLQVFLFYQLPTHFREASFQNNETRHDQSFQTGKLWNWK